MRRDVAILCKGHQTSSASAATWLRGGTEADAHTCLLLLQGQAHRRSSVMKCLLSQLDELGGVCETEISRAARMALWEYTPGACDWAVVIDCVCLVQQSHGQPIVSLPAGAGLIELCG